MKKIFIILIFAFFLTSCNLISQPTKNVNYSLEVDNLKYNGPFTQHAMPSFGNVKVLVVPINFYSRNKTDENLEKINLAFNGKKEDTEYQSVKSYYEEASYNQLHLTFEVTDWYLPKYGGSYYEGYSSEEGSGINVLVSEVISYFDSKYDYKDFDSDLDGYIDAVWLVYNRPSSASSDFWWAYTISASISEKWDNKKVRFFSFASVDMIRNGIDASTFIHETGHLLGLDDYYSYDPKNQSGGLYGYDMMDSNKGDHASISKILLGWVKPRVISSSGEYELESFAKSKDVLLVSNHTVTSIYDEYFLIDYFTPDGLNENQNMFRYGPSSSRGIRVYHVNAKISYDSSGNVSVGESEYYSTGFKYNNSNANNKFVSLLKANSIDEKDTLNSSLSGLYLYTTLSLQFGSSIYQNYQYFDGSSLNFKFNVLELGDKAKISLEVM